MKQKSGLTWETKIKGEVEVSTNYLDLSRYLVKISPVYQEEVRPFDFSVLEFSESRVRFGFQEPLFASPP